MTMLLNKVLLLLCGLLFSGHAARGSDWCSRCVCQLEHGIPVAMECASRSDVLLIPNDLPPALSRLVITKTAVHKVDTTIRFYTQLELLNLTSNNIHDIAPSSFLQSRRLVRLDLSGNKLHSISSPLFQGLQSLRELHLQNNMLENLPANAFTAIPNLEHLDVSNNRIFHVDDRGFQGLTRLRSLHLDNNQLRQPPSGSFPPIAGLIKLHLSGNSFDSVPSRSFMALSKLEELFLRNCRIRDLSSSTFGGGLEASLRSLDLSYNEMPEFPLPVLGAMKKLEVLQMGSNYFRTVSLRGLSSLKEFYLNGCFKDVPLSLDERTFAGLPHLTTVNVTNCPGLRQLKGFLFADNHNLKVLNLKGNGLEQIDEGAVSWDQLDWLDLRANRISCSCGMQWLSTVYKLKSAAFPTPDCFSPPQWHGVPIIQVDFKPMCSAVIEPETDDHRSSKWIWVGCLLATVALFVAGCGILIAYRRKYWCFASRRRKFKQGIRKADICVVPNELSYTPKGFMDVEPEHIYEEPLILRGNFPDVKTTEI